MAPGSQGYKFMLEAQVKTRQLGYSLENTNKTSFSPIQEFEFKGESINFT